MVGVRAERLLLPGEGKGASWPEDLLAADGRLVVAGVVVVRVEGQPRFVERAHLWRLARAGEVVAPPEDVERTRLLEVGQAVARRARTPEEHARYWAGLFLRDPRASVVEMCRQTGVSVKEGVRHLAALIEREPERYALFDLREGVWRRGEETRPPPGPWQVLEELPRA